MISNQRLCLDKAFDSQFSSIGDIYLKSDSELFHLIKTENDHQGKERVDVIQTIHFKDLIPDLSSRFRSARFNFFKLSSGNYLHVSSKYLESEVRRNRSNPRMHYVSVEIDKEELKVVKVSVKLPEEIKGEINASKIQFANNRLVFKAKIRGQPGGGLQDRREPSLVLSTTGFDILDHCSQSKLPEYSSSIMAVSDSRVASIGSGFNKVYLHEIDFEANRLILLKTVIFGGFVIRENPPSFQKSTAFMCLVSPDKNSGTENQGSVLLKLDMELDLVATLKLSGSSLLDLVFPIGETKAVCLEKRGEESGCLFVIDMEARAVHLANNLQDIGSGPKFCQEQQSGRVFNVELKPDQIVKMLLK